MASVDTTIDRTVETPADPDTRLSARIIRFLSRAPIHILLVLIAIFWLIPTTGLFITSLLTPSDAALGGWWNFVTKPSAWTLDNYATMFDNEGITHALWVTTLVTIGATILPILVASLAAYALAWIDFPGRDWLFLAVVGLLLVPIQMALIPIFRLYNNFNLFDTIPGLILFHSAFALPLGIFLLRNFFIGIPRDLMEAARIDGASEWRLFFKVVLPLGIPAIASLAIFQVLFVWNDLLVGLVLAQSNQPIAPEIASQLRQFGSNLSVIAPASFFSAIVPLTVFALFQRYFVQGLLAGSVK
jgi:alpha-glucoside transport system permease protein